MSIKLVIADDHFMIREGLKRLLESDKNLQVVAEAADGIEALEKLKTVKTDILLLDINMPNMDGIETLKQIRQQNMNIKVLILTFHSELEYLTKAVDCGCDGYILKSSEYKILREAVYSIYNGKKIIQQSLIEKFNSSVADKISIDEKISELTKREVEVLKLIADGLFNKEIAAKLIISERTVKNHVSNIFKKIDVSDRTQAAVFAIKNNIVNL